MAITLTESAAAKVKTLFSEKGPSDTLGLRVRVVGGGCSGLSYDLALETEARPDDKVFESQGVKIYLDPKSALFVSGTEIDFQKTLMGEGFAFRNPNAKGSCGCGSSFTA